jgi:hypothetical protein
MRIPHISTLLLAAALATTPSIAAFADPATTAQTLAPTAADPPAAPATSEAEQYAAREAKDTSVTKFRGGGETLVIGASSVGVLLLVLIIVILL